MAGVLGELESTRVARALREDILLGRRPPGSRLVERDIAAELDVSRLPVREAIRRLVAEGIVVARPRTWAVVREFTLDDVREFAEVRASFEGLLFVYAAERHDEAGLAHLQEILEREERSARDGDLQAARMAAGAFHEYMGHLADNEVLLELVEVFATRLKLIFGGFDDPNSMAASHRGLFEAIRDRDVDLVRRLVADHLEAGHRAAVRRFEKLEADAPPA